MRGTAETWILTLARRRVIEATRLRRAMPTDGVVEGQSDGTTSDSKTAVDDKPRPYASLAKLSCPERRLLEPESWGGFMERDVARMGEVPLRAVKTRSRRTLS